MAHASRIEWTETTWNPVVGCTKVSSGCKNCYAERMAKRLAAIARGSINDARDPGRTGHYLHVLNRRSRWNGHVVLDHDALGDPETWRSPRFVFVNSMSDLFHDEVPTDFIQLAYDVMVRCPRHSFQILTKRPHRAAALSDLLPWPRNVWLGASVENAAVVHRIDELRHTGARIKFLSIEPLLGPIPDLDTDGLDWVIVGGESGPGARPMRAEWVRQIRDRCVSNGVAFFFKQWGGVNKKSAGRVLDGRTWDEMPLDRAGGSSRDELGRAVR